MRLHTGGRPRRGAAAPLPRDDDYERAVLSRLAEAVGARDRATAFSIRPLRSAGRSRSYLVECVPPGRPPDRWFVKQVRPEGVQDDLAGPVSAEEEFRALQRLHSHLSRQGGAVRVPRPDAVFPELSAVAMEYVSGRRLVDLLRYRSVIEATEVLDALTACGGFLERVHALEHAPAQSVDLRAESESVLRFAAERLEPAGLSLPRKVEQVLHQVPRMFVESPLVLLHGDFVPHNIILADDGSPVGVDPALVAVGPPEGDLARFIAVMSSGIRFAPELAVPPLGGLRRVLVDRLLTAYPQHSDVSLMLDVRLLQLLPRRWLRLRHLALQQERRSLVDLRLRLIGAQMRLLMEESAGRLVRQLS